jgi:hypothetical protein
MRLFLSCFCKRGGGVLRKVDCVKQMCISELSNYLSECMGKVFFFFLKVRGHKRGRT